MNNRYYSDIEIDNAVLQSLPVDGELPNIAELEETDISKERDNIDDADQHDVTHTYVPMTFSTETEKEAISKLLTGKTKWPESGSPINEYRTEGLATMCFPWLFPDGTADPTATCTLTNVSFLERV